MLHHIVIIILELTIGLSICAAVHTQINAYDDIQNSNDFDQSPFVKIGDNYYIIETTEEVTWFGAAHQCRQKGANLASIETADEMRELHEYLIAKHPDEKSFWLSGNDLDKENQFQWLGTGQSMEYTNWDDNQPDDYECNEDCVHIRNESGLFKFNDLKCTETTKYICEADNPKQISIAIW